MPPPEPVYLPTTDKPCRDATSYLPDLIPSLAVWLRLRTFRSWVPSLVGFDKRCIVCEQPTCNYWTRCADMHTEWFEGRQKHKRMLELAPLPYIGQRRTSHNAQRPILLHQRPDSRCPIVRAKPEPKISHLSRQLAQVPIPTNPCVESETWRICRLTYIHS